MTYAGYRKHTAEGGSRNEEKIQGIMLHGVLAPSAQLEKDPPRPRDHLSNHLSSLGAKEMKVIVDADACPRAVLEIVRRMQAKFGYELRTVSSFNHLHEGPEHLTVGGEDQATDLAVANLASRGDLVITQDWGLAALALAKGAHALDPSGRRYTGEQIAFLLEERNLKARYRRGGGRTRGPSARTREDDARFAETFMDLLGQMPGPD